MSPGFSLFMTAGAEILCLLVILRQGHSIGREKFAHRERDVAEQAARIIRTRRRSTPSPAYSNRTPAPAAGNPAPAARWRTAPESYRSGGRRRRRKAPRRSTGSRTAGTSHRSQSQSRLQQQLSTMRASSTMGSTASTTAMGVVGPAASSGISGSPARISEEKILALPSLPNRMARLSKTHRPSTVTGAGQLI